MQPVSTIPPSWANKNNTIPRVALLANFFALHSHTYVIIADHYSGWITIYYFKQGETTAASIERIFQELFITFGVPDKLSTDGGL